MAEINRLSARGVAAITEPGRHADGGNLYLNVSKTGARSWVFFYRKDGKQREMGLGGYPAISLAAARAIATEARRLLAQGGDPLEAKRAARADAKAQVAAALTFGEYAKAYVAAHEDGWRNEKHRDQWRMTLLGPQVQAVTGKAASRKPAPDYCRELRKVPVAEVRTEDVLAVLRPIWGEKRETANRIRQRVEVVLNAAVVEGKRPPGMNPAAWRGHLALLLPAHKRGVSKGHFTSLPWQEMPAFFAALGEREGVAARALEALILTAARSGEVRGMTWGEVDLDRAIWLVPGERMKMGKPHRVPLCERAVAAIKSMLPLRPRRPEDQAAALVFPGLRRAPLSDMTLAAVLKRMEVPVTVHGFRASFRTWGSEATASQFEVLESALAHAPASAVVAAYQRGDHFDRRVELMRAWEAFLTAPPADDKVVPIRAAEA